MSESTTVQAERESLAGYLRTVLAPEQSARPLLLSFNQWDFATATVAEIAATVHEMGSSPVIGLWADKTPIRDVGWTTSALVSRVLLSKSRDERTRRALESLGLPSSAFVDPPLRHWKPKESLPVVDALHRSALRKITYRDANLGRALLQVNPDRETPITDEYLWPRRWVSKSIESYAWVYDQTRELIERTDATCAAVFNGRFLHDHAVAEAARHSGIPTLSFDFGGNDTDFDITIDDTHDWSALQGRMRRMFEDWDPDERVKLGSRWFEERRVHADPRNRLFVESQTQGHGIDVPQGKKIVVYFSSSGDEISELDLDWSEYFNGQPGAIKILAEEVRNDPDAVLIVRTHPHKRMKPKRDVQDWYEAVAEAKPDIHLDEFSDVDSYTLMSQADVVVTYGSTTGVEAGFARRPVIVMGPCAYDELGCATRVRNRSELQRALANPEPGDWMGALAYGLMMLRRGFTYRFVSRKNDAVAVLGGHEIADASATVLKLSDALMKTQHRWLKRRS
jgi:hypothetical protein